MLYGGMRKLFLATAWLQSLLIFSCNTSFTGELKPNAEPETFMIVDTIVRTDSNRMSSQVHIVWWGDDPDGFVAGYEFTFDSIITTGTTWQFTTAQDSIFLLTTPPGSDTADFPFYVRAVDNLGAVDPSPAHLVFPVKNSPPSVKFIYAENNPVKSFPVLRFFWEGSDPDGSINLDRFELCWNDTLVTPYTVGVVASGAVFEALSPSASESDCRVYLNNNSEAQETNMPGLLPNSNNTLYIRAVDQAGAASRYVASSTVFVKKVTSDILIVDGYSSNSGPVVAFYSDQLSTAGFSVLDTLHLFAKQNNVYAEQSADNVTQSKIFSLFKAIIWFTNDASNSLSIGQRTLNEFFNLGGRLLMSVYVSSLFDEQSGFLDFTPIESFVVPADTTLLLTDTSKVLALLPEYPDLLSTSYVGVVRPFIPVVAATAMYDAELIAKDNNTLTLSAWEGGSIVMAKKYNSSGATNFIISTLELHKLNGLVNMNEFFDTVMHVEFGF